jgi:hypothetical protein
MDESRLSGTARDVGGKVEEGIGSLAGSAKTQIQDKLDLYRGCRGSWHRLAARPNASAAMINGHGWRKRTR